MSENNHIDKIYLEKLVKETLTSNKNPQNKEEIDFEEPEAVTNKKNNSQNLEEKNVDIELQILVDSLLSVNEQAAKSALEKLFTTGESLDLIYLAAVDRMYDVYFSKNVVSEQNKQKQTTQTIILEQNTPEQQFQTSIDMMNILATSLREAGREKAAKEVESVIRDTKTAGEAELGLAILSKTHFNLSPENTIQRLDLGNFKDMQPVEAGMASGRVQLLKLFWSWARRTLTRGGRRTGSKKIKKRGANQRKRAAKNKRRRNRQNRRKRKKTPGGNVTPIPTPFQIPQLPWKKISAFLGVLFYEEIIDPLKAIGQDIKKLHERGKLFFSYEGSHIQYALENFKGTHTNTEEYKKVKNFFSLFSRFDPSSSNCIPVTVSMSVPEEQSCSNTTSQPELYYMPIELENSLKNKENSIDSIIKSTNIKDREKIYLYLYRKYKKIFKDSSVTDHIVDNIIFINEQQAKNFAKVAARDNISPNKYIKYCIIPILNLDHPKLSQWSEVTSQPDNEGELHEEIIIYKEDFIEEYFEPEYFENSPDSEVSKEVKLLFSSFSAATQTQMIEEKGGFDAIVNCVKTTKINSENSQNRREYALQAQKIKMFAAIFAGGVLDQKVLDLMSTAVKKYMKKRVPTPDVKDLGGKGWSGILKYWPIIEMAFYFTDPVNVVERKFMKNSFANIQRIIDEEAEYFAKMNKKEWVIRDEKLKLIQNEIDSIFDEINEEMNVSIDRFYDVVEDEASLCQQLNDKIKIRSAMREVSQQFKVAVYQGFQESYQKTGKLGTQKAKERTLGPFTITHENWQYVSDSIPLLNDEVSNLHRQVAVPEIGFFMQAQMASPEEFLKTIRSKGQAEDDEFFTRRYDDPTGRDPIIFRRPRRKKLYEQNNKEGSDFIVLPENFNLKDYYDNIPGLMDEIRASIFTKDEKKFLKVAAESFKIISFYNIQENLSKRLERLTGFVARKPRRGKDPRDVEPINKAGITPFISQHILSNEEVMKLIKDGYDAFKQTIKSDERFYKNFVKQNKIKGCLIEFPVYQGSSSGLWPRNSNFGSILIANSIRGISLKYPFLLGNTFFKSFSPLTNVASIGLDYENNSKQIFKLFNDPIRATKKYKIIYDPNNIDIRTGSNGFAWATNISEIQGSPEIAVDMLINIIQSNNNINIPNKDEFKNNIIPKEIQKTLKKGNDRAHSYLSGLVSEITEKANDAKIQILEAMDDSVSLSNLTNTWSRENPRFLEDNIRALNRVLDICRSFSVVNNVLRSAYTFVYIDLNIRLDKLYASLNTEYKKLNAKKIIENISAQIDNITPLYFLRPAGLLAGNQQIYGRDIDAAGLRQPESDPVARANLDPEAERCMFVSFDQLNTIIEDNYKTYNNIVNEIEKLNPNERLKSFGLQEKVEEDFSKFGQIIKLIHLLNEHSRSLSDSGFDLHGFYKKFIT